MSDRVFNQLFLQCIEGQVNNVLVIYDNTTSELLQQVCEELQKIGKVVTHIKIETSDAHGKEPNKEVVDMMLETETIICITKYSLAHTAARRKAEQKGIPFLSMPDYNTKMLDNPAFDVQYHERYGTVNRYSDFFENGNIVRVLTKKGTNLTMNITGRKGNCCPGMTTKQMLLGSPPDIEANIAPLETETEGILVIDGSITDYRIGRLEKPIVLKIVQGRIEDIQSECDDIVQRLHGIFQKTSDENAKIVGEFGIGFNNHAKLCGNMLIDEGAQGCVHFGMGSNWTIGGKNKVDFHLDFVMKNATVYIDKKKIIDEGRILYEHN